MKRAVNARQKRATGRAATTDLLGQLGQGGVGLGALRVGDLLRALRGLCTRDSQQHDHGERARGTLKDGQQQDGTSALARDSAAAAASSAAMTSAD